MFKLHYNTPFPYPTESTALDPVITDPCTKQCGRMGSSTAHSKDTLGSVLDERQATD